MIEWSFVEIATIFCVGIIVGWALHWVGTKD